MITKKAGQPTKRKSNVTQFGSIREKTVSVSANESSLSSGLKNSKHGNEEPAR